MALFSTLGAGTISARIPQYDRIFQAVAARYNLAVELLYAIASHESDVRATAIGPTSDYGLMQVTLSTYSSLTGNKVDTPARIAAAAAALQDPATNVDLAGQVLAQNIARTNGDVLWAISAYNRGFKTTVGGQTVTRGRLPNGQFPNQSYVDDVVKWVTYYRQRANKPTAVTAENLTEAGFGGIIPILILIGAVIGGLILARVK